MGYWTNRAIFSFLKYRPAPSASQFPVEMLAPIALPTLASIKAYVRRVAWMSNIQGIDPVEHFEEVTKIKSVRVLSQIYPVAICLIYVFPIFINGFRLMFNQDSMEARYAIGALVQFWPVWLLLLIFSHVVVRWTWIFLHARVIAKKLKN